VFRKLNSETQHRTLSKKLIFVCVGLFALSVLTLGFAIVNAALTKLRARNNVFSVRFEQEFKNDAKLERFGWNANTAWETIAQNIESQIQNCRQHFEEGSLPLKFEMKVSYENRALKTVSLTNTGGAKIAACVRDKIETLQFPEISYLRKLNSSDYTLYLVTESMKSNEKR
jgi:hypothetical protein